MNIPVKWLVPAVLLVVFSPILSIVASVKIAEKNTQDQAQAQVMAEEKAREAARVITCNLFGAILDSYKEEPPITSSGVNVRNTWLEMYRLSRCQPLRKE